MTLDEFKNEILGGEVINHTEVEIQQMYDLGNAFYEAAYFRFREMRKVDKKVVN